MEPDPAPIALFAFNRPAHTRQALDALARNPLAGESDLHVFVDGPRGAHESALVDEVAGIGAGATGFKSVQLHRSASNRGLFGAITSGVSQVLERRPAVIVVEDDIVACPSFLRYMNDALERYREVAQVGSIHAYAPPVAALPEFYFLPGGDCWGWATWADRWRLFEPDAASLVRRIVQSGRLRAFCSVQGYRSLLMLCQRALGRNGSWALPWHASLFLAGRLTLHPGVSFVANIGNDASESDRYETALRSTYDGLPAIPVLADANAASRISGYYDAGAARGPLAALRVLALRCYATLLSRRIARGAIPGAKRHD
jgi:hypothetical protein